MALDKLVDSSQLDSDLTSVANAIRTKGGTSAQLAFPSGFVSAIQTLPSGGSIDWNDFATRAVPSGLITLTCTVIGDASMVFNPSTSWQVYSKTVTEAKTNAFKTAKNLTSVRLPYLTEINSGYTFYQCSNLTFADIGSANKIQNSFFIQTALNTLIIRKTTICPLAAVNNFNNTAFRSGGPGGTIYIPKVLYDHLGDGSSSDYKAATNWSTLDGYGTITWSKIEGSPYENPEGNW